MQIAHRELKSKDSVEISFEMKNSGSRAGTEVVLVYSIDEVASITPSIRKLRAFERVSLEANESKTIKMKIPVSQLRFVDKDNKWVLEPGKFKFEVSQLTDSINIQP
jgi:beta-glucosidase